MEFLLHLGFWLAASLGTLLLLARFGIEPSPREIRTCALSLNLLASVFIASDGIQWCRWFYDEVPLVMPWRDVSAALTRIESGPAPPSAALTYLDAGFDHIIAAARTANATIPAAPSWWEIMPLSTRSTALFRVSGFAATVRIQDRDIPFTQVSGLIVGASDGSAIVLGTVGDLRGLVEQYRRSWFITRGLAPMIVGFTLQLIALLSEPRPAPAAASDGRSEPSENS